MEMLEGYAFEGGPEEGVLRIDGAATLDGCEKIKAALLAALGRCRTLTLDVSGVTQADLSFLQLLCAADKSAKARGGSLAHLHAPSAAVVEAVRTTGFDMLDPQVVGIALFTTIPR
ncbi:MAG: STAS domain-containing protein [Desulfovibrionaceae bacterium]